MTYLKTDESRIAQPTAHTKGDGIKTNNEGSGYWWLRTHGDTGEKAVYVNAEGKIVNIGANTNIKYFGVRPAMWVTIGN